MATTTIMTTMTTMTTTTTTVSTTASTTYTLFSCFSSFPCSLPFCLLSSYLRLCCQLCLLLSYMITSHHPCLGESFLIDWNSLTGVAGLHMLLLMDDSSSAVDFSIFLCTNCSSCQQF